MDLKEIDVYTRNCVDWAQDIFLESYCECRIESLGSISLGVSLFEGEKYIDGNLFRLLNSFLNCNFNVSFYQTYILVRKSR